MPTEKQKESRRKFGQFHFGQNDTPKDDNSRTQTQEEFDRYIRRRLDGGRTIRKNLEEG